MRHVTKRCGNFMLAASSWVAVGLADLVLFWTARLVAMSPAGTVRALAVASTWHTHCSGPQTALERADSTFQNWACILPVLATRGYVFQGVGASS